MQSPLLPLFQSVGVIELQVKMIISEDHTMGMRACSKRNGTV